MAELTEERYELAIERISQIPDEERAGERFRPWFRRTAEFILLLDRFYRCVSSGDYRKSSLEELKEWNRKLYEDILPENYETSCGNPAYAVQELGEEYGQILSFLYAEIRGGIPYAAEGKTEYLDILYELFIEIYNCFEEEDEPELRTLRDIIYWYASDYCDVFVADRIEEQIDPAKRFALDIIEGCDLSDFRYLYFYGEYVGENELGTARYLAALPEETVQKMADVYTEGYRIGFVSTGKDLSKKGTVNIRYVLGFERVVKKAVENFRAMGLEPVIYRAAGSVLTKRGASRVGYYGGIPNMQYDYDHRNDQGLFFGKRFMERKLEVARTTYERNRELARALAGPAVMETFGEKPFSPKQKKEAVSLSSKQEELQLLYDSRSSQMTNEYIPGDERSFTIIAWPVPEIGEKYPEIFDQVIRINTLDAEVYGSVQQKLIDALDKGKYVRILGKDGNRTDMKVQLYRLSDPEKETIFENCVADVNIPVGEVFTSPALEGTEGTLHVSQVYLNGLQFRDLELTFEDGMITGYRCGNFEDEEEGRKYIFDNILFKHETLPLGEFAIGTNTTAYVTARKYGIGDKMPILIAEKTGPHFAVGDTCYSWAEDISVYNPDGKEIVARDNSVSIKRKEDPARAYFHCHTDITIPYEELGRIAVVTGEGEEIPLIENGEFVLPGTEILNEPLKNTNK